MTDEQLKALTIVGVLLSTVSGVGGFAGGRMSVPVPPVVAAPAPEIQYRIVEVPVPVPVLPGKTTDRVDQEPFADPKAGQDGQPSAAPKPAQTSSPAKPAPKAHPKVEKKAAAKKPRTPSGQQRKPTASECGQMRLGIAAVGRDDVISAGRSRGYSNAQVDRALRDCGL